MKKIIKNRLWFTLVELIVVITILAILGTIAFISLQWYSKDARDSKRISDIANIEISLELFSLATWKYPLPDNPQTVIYSWSIVLWNQWTVWWNVATNLSKNLSEIPLDPLYGTEYVYSTLENRKEYELMSVYEWGNIGGNWLLDNTYAATSPTVKIVGTYNGLFIHTSNYIIPSPSIITSETLPLAFDAQSIQSQVVTGWTNVPNIWTSKVQVSTGALSNITLSAYIWSADANSYKYELLSLYKTIQWAYTGSSLIGNWIYKALFDQTSNDEKVVFIDSVLNITRSSPINIITWSELDLNCDADDIPIWDQVWAWCNSTLWLWLEWGQLDWDLWTNNYNWGWSFCFNYEWGAATCIKWDITMASNTKANTWYTGTNSNWDTEFASIWWKSYTWENSGSACAPGFHVPTDAELEILETTLKWGVNCRNSTNWELCAWLGWAWHNAQSTTNNMAQALKIPLSVNRLTNLIDSYNRGNYAHLWSSTEGSSGTAYGRSLKWDTTTINRLNWSTDYAFNVRCIHD